MKLICLLSGGIDSPVAAWRMKQKGYEIVLAHFHNQTASSRQVEQKIKSLANILKAPLHLIPFKDIQMEVIKHVPSKYRMIVYRRLMFKLAEEVLKKEKASGFVTGDSLGQVASQTLENMNVIYSATKYPILAPLIGENKEETIETARKIGTYETSILPYEDCCTFFVAQHPETKARLDEIEILEKNINTKAPKF